MLTITYKDGNYSSDDGNYNGSEQDEKLDYLRTFKICIHVQPRNRGKRGNPELDIPMSFLIYAVDKRAETTVHAKHCATAIAWTASTRARSGSAGGAVLGR